MSNLASKMRQGTINRLAAAIAADPMIAITPAELEQAEGSTEKYLLSLGLTHSDLLRLERCGFALRGYLRQHHRLGRGPFMTRWLIVDLNTKEETNVGTEEQK